MTHDPVNNPAHYTKGRKYEPADVIHDWGLGYFLGNAVKYISRAGRKSDDAMLDLEKAAWYLRREIAALNARKPVPTAEPAKTAHRDVTHDTWKTLQSDGTWVEDA